MDANLIAPVAAWATEVHTLFRPNGPGRQFGILSQHNLNTPQEVWEIKSRTCAELINAEQEPIYQDFCGYITNGGAIHQHSDPAPSGKTHVRINVMVSRPNRGGMPVLDGVELDVCEGGIWRCEASRVRHWCTPVIGPKPRIVLSFGFLV